MEFYVLAKTTDDKNGDVIIDLSKLTVMLYNSRFQLNEDYVYEIQTGQLRNIKNHQWSIHKAYRLVFQQSDEDIDLNGFSFIEISKRDSITIDENGLLYKNGSFLGKLMNKREITLLKNDGADKLSKSLQNY